MATVLEKTISSAKTVPEKLYYKVFLAFRKPDGGISIFIGDGSNDCGVYAALAKIFQKHPREIYEAISKLAYEGGDGFMQEYLSLDEAATAVSQATLFANMSLCFCFKRQEAHFYMKEVKK